MVLQSHLQIFFSKKMTYTLFQKVYKCDRGQSSHNSLKLETNIVHTLKQMGAHIQKIPEQCMNKLLV